MKNQFLFIFELHDIAHFEAIFGQQVTGRAWQDIQNAAFSSMSDLLNRYQFTQAFECKEVGQCHSIFEAKNDGAMMDIEEQKPIIIQNGRKLIREVFIEQLGLATGRKISFSIAIAELPEHIAPQQLNIDQYNELKAKALEDVKQFELDDADQDMSPYAPISRTQFEQMLLDKSIQTFFQSIVSLPSGDIVGYEALTRGPEDSAIQRADLLFNSAAHFGLTDELELLCIEKALDWVPKIPEAYWVSLNIGPKLLTSEKLESLLQASQYQTILPRLVFELTEHLPLESAEQIKERVQALKERGIRLSLDDTGCGFFDLDTVEQLQPSIVKLCITVIRRIQGQDEVAEEIRQTRQRIHELNGVTLGEGVETQEQRQVLESCGVTLAQGYLFDRPTAAKTLFTH